MTTGSPEARRSRGRRVRLTAFSLAVAVATLWACAGTAAAEFGIPTFDGQVRANQAGDPFTQAGGHPYDASASFAFTTEPKDLFPSVPMETPTEGLKDLAVDLPAGFVGNPMAMPRCPRTVLGAGACPVSTIVGSVAWTGVAFSGNSRTPIFNVEPERGRTAQFAFFTTGYLTYITGSLVRIDGEYRLRMNLQNVNQTLGVIDSTATFWGTPADPVHDFERCNAGVGVFDAPTCPGTPGDVSLGPNPAGVPEVAFLSNPSTCTAPGVGVTTDMRVWTWENPGTAVSASFESHLPPAYPADPSTWGPPQGPTGCDQVPFDPELSVVPTSRVAGEPTGLDVRLSVPQEDLLDPDAIAPAHLKRARVTLPEGMVVSPAAADGLGACSQAELDIDSQEPAECPASSKIGTVEVTTPLLEEKLPGSVYLARQSDNPFGSLLALYIQVHSEERGITVKLPGRVDPDPVTGRLTATFDDNPQFPFSELRVRFKDGPRAALVNPDDCGIKTATARQSSWARTDEPVSRSSSFAIDQGCEQGEFAPEFSAGSRYPAAGSFSPLGTRIVHDGAGELGRIDVRLPNGAIARLRGVELCTNAQAASAAGRSGRLAQGSPSCPAASQIGTTTVGTGGPNPYYPADPGHRLLGAGVPDRGLQGRSVRSRDRGSRGRRAVRPRRRHGAGRGERRPRDGRADGRVGSPAADSRGHSARRQGRSRQHRPATLRDDPDELRPGGGRRDDPRSGRQVGRQAGPLSGRGLCAARVRSAPGDAAQWSSPDQDRRAPRVQGDSHAGLRPGRSRPGEGDDAEERRARPDQHGRHDEGVRLRRLAARGLPAGDRDRQGDGPYAGAQPAAVRPVYLVQGIKFGTGGNRIRTTPSLLVKLRGEVAINLRARSDVTGGRLVTTFPQVPDAPVSRFDMRIAGGKRGILVVTRTRRAKVDLCAGRQVANVETDGQNGRTADYATTVKAPCGGKAARKANRSGSSRR